MQSKTLTPDNMQLALTSPVGFETQLIDYASIHAHKSTDNLLAHASEFINNRQAKLESYLLLAFASMIELGSALEIVKERLAHGEFEKWLIDNTIIDVDTARNYRNVYKHFRELLIETPQEALQRLNWRMLYRLATRNVQRHCREWFIKYISDEPETANDERLVTIARYLPVELRARLDSAPAQLNIEQAHSLALAYKAGLDGYIYRLVIEQEVKSGYVAQELNRLYLEMSAAARRDRALAYHKTFAQLVRDDYRLVWFDTQTGDNSVSLAEATKDTFIRYMSARRRSHMPQLTASRVTGDIKIIEGELYVRIADRSVLPLSYEPGDKILVDLLIDDTKERSNHAQITGTHDDNPQLSVSRS